MDIYGTPTNTRPTCIIQKAHCEQCGRIVDEDCGVWDGYTSCCNELVSYGPEDCRDYHGEEARAS